MFEDEATPYAVEHPLPVVVIFQRAECRRSAELFTLRSEGHTIRAAF